MEKIRPDIKITFPPRNDGELHIQVDDLSKYSRRFTFEHATDASRNAKEQLKEVCRLILATLK